MFTLTPGNTEIVCIYTGWDILLTPSTYLGLAIYLYFSSENINQDLVGIWYPNLS